MGALAPNSREYGKSDLIEYMLNEPPSSDHDDAGSTADRLIALVLDTGIEFFHDPDQRGWASIRIDGHWENHQISSRPFQLFLLRTYYRETGNSPAHRRSAPRWSCSRRKLCLMATKLSFTCGSQIIDRRFISTCVTTPGGAIEIDARGWRLVDRPSARFHRTRGSQPLPTPSVAAVWANYVASSTSTTKAGRYQVFSGRRASAGPSLPRSWLLKVSKGRESSTACRVINSLVDPRIIALRGIPARDSRSDGSCEKFWLVCFDNLSHLSEELADAACRLATGGGFGGRELYRDHDEAVFDVRLYSTRFRTWARRGLIFLIAHW